MINKNFPGINAIRSETNLGFAGGNNLGIKHAKGEFVFFVNNDTLLAENVIEELIKPFYDIENLGIVSPKVIYYDSPNIIQYAGCTEINSLTGRNKVIGHKTYKWKELGIDAEEYIKSQPVLVTATLLGGAIGACSTGTASLFVAPVFLSVWYC